MLLNRGRDALGRLTPTERVELGRLVVKSRGRYQLSVAPRAAASARAGRPRAAAGLARTGPAPRLPARARRDGTGPDEGQLRRVRSRTQSRRRHGHETPRHPEAGWSDAPPGVHSSTQAQRAPRQERPADARQRRPPRDPHPPQFVPARARAATEGRKSAAAGEEPGAIAAGDPARAGAGRRPRCRGDSWSLWLPLVATAPEPVRCRGDSWSLWLPLVATAPRARREAADGRRRRRPRHPHPPQFVPARAPDDPLRRDEDQRRRVRSQVRSRRGDPGAGSEAGWSDAPPGVHSSTQPERGRSGTGAARRSFRLDDRAAARAEALGEPAVAPRGVG